MANTLKIKRSSISGKVPLTTDLQLGELAVNTYDGKLFLKKDVGGVESIVDVSAGIDANSILTLLKTVDGSGSGLDADLVEGMHAVSTNTVNSIVARDASGNFSAGTITAALSGNASTTTKLATARTISITGDVTGSVSFDGSADASITATIAANSVALGTDTTGNYVADVTAGSYITKSGTAGEGWSPTIAVDATSANTASKVVARDASGNFSAGTITATLSGNATTATTATNIAGGSAGTLPYQTAAGTTAMLAAGTSGYFLKSNNTSAPSWAEVSLTDLPDAWTKKSVRVATTANITLSAPQTIDGVAVVAGDRVLVKDQTTASQNGIYVVAAGAWTLATDANTASKLAGACVNVDSGTTNGGVRFDTDFKSTDTLGTTAVTWAKIWDSSNLTNLNQLTNGPGYTTNTGTVTSVAMTVPTGLTVNGSPITTSGTLAITLTSGYSIPTTASQTNWDSAYTDRLKWDGGSTGLTASTGRSSLGATTVGSNLFTLTNPSAVTFLRVNADNTVSTLDAATFRTAIGAGTSSTTGTVTSIATGTGLSGGTITTSGTISLANTAVTAGSYTAANITVDAQGRITAASNGTASFSGGTLTSVLYGVSTGMPMVANEGTPGSFEARAAGTGDSNLAGMTFHNQGYYAIKLGIRADGYFGLGGWSRAAWSWYSDPSGNMVAAGNVTAYSDPRLKENFAKVENPLEILSKLDGGTFNWKRGYSHTECKAGSRDYGILADQVELVMPEIVTESIEIDGEKYKTVAYEKLIPVLIEAIKELKAEIDLLKSVK